MYIVNSHARFEVSSEESREECCGRASKARCARQSRSNACVAHVRPGSCFNPHLLSIVLIPTGSCHIVKSEDTLTLMKDQEANFSYLTGCQTPSASVLVIFDDDSMTHRLFVPRADPLETMWSVAPPTLEESREAFDSDQVSYVDELAKVINDNKDLIIHTLPNTVEFPAITVEVERNDKLLLDALQAARIVKDEHEIDLIREANRISSDAHEVLMRELGRFAGKRRDFARTGKEGLQEWEVESESDAEALFVASCRRAG